MATITDTKARNIKPADPAIPHGNITGLALHPSSTKGHGKWVLRYVSPVTGKRRNAGLGVLAFVRLDAERSTGELTQAMERAIAQIPEVVSCHYISGTGTFELQVVARDLDSFSQFARDVLLNLPNVKDMHTSFSLGEVKASSALPLTHLARPRP